MQCYGTFCIVVMMHKPPAHAHLQKSAVLAMWLQYERSVRAFLTSTCTGERQTSDRLTPRPAIINDNGASAYKLQENNRPAIVCHCFNLLINSEGGKKSLHGACIVSAI